MYLCCFMPKLVPVRQEIFVAWIEHKILLVLTTLCNRKLMRRAISFLREVLTTINNLV